MVENYRKARCNWGTKLTENLLAIFPFHGYGLLLLINLVVLAGVLLRPAPERLPVTQVGADSFAEKLERARQQDAAAIPVPRNDALTETAAEDTSDAEDASAARTPADKDA